MQSSSNVQILSNELRIGSVQASDIGSIRCTSRNPHGFISTSTQIIIAGPAVITIPPRNTTTLGNRAPQLLNYTMIINAIVNLKREIEWK